MRFYLNFKPNQEKTGKVLPKLRLFDVIEIHRNLPESSIIIIYIIIQHIHKHKETELLY